jgi:MoaA/NifB/PqqE/SkfB family radical SAM enzyme
MDIPIRLDLEITRRCKYKCGICSVRAQENVNYEEISLDELRSKIKEFWELGGKEISITGGEPLERGLEFLSNLIRFSKNLDLHVRMYTVGYGIQNLESARVLGDAGLDAAYVSLEGNKEVDETYKGVKGSYDVAIKAIGFLRSVGINVVIHFTPTKLNYTYFPEVVKMADYLGVKKIRVMAYVEQGRGWDNRTIYTMNDEDNRIFNRILRTIRTEYDIELQFSGVFAVKAAGESSCMLGKRRFVITSDGFLIPSFAVRMHEKELVPDMRFNLGKTKEVSLGKMWSSLMVEKGNNGCGLCSACSKGT